MRSLASSALLVLALSSVAACSTPRSGVPHDSGHGTGDSGGPSACGAGVSSICRGTTSIACNADGSEGASTSCASGACVANMGCRVCSPGSGSCDGNDVRQCRADGSGYDVIHTCDPSTGASCNAALLRCSSPCADAEAANSYIGCEYWPVPTLNNGLRGIDPTRSAFHFAVAIANPGTNAATVTVDRGGTMIATRTVAGGALDVIQLPWDEALQADGMTHMGTGAVQTVDPNPSVLERAAAYHLVSTLPVTVYQFNPLEYQQGSGLSRINSFTNDASLLLPTHAMTGNYIVMSRPTDQMRALYRTFLPPHTLAGDITQSSPGFFTLVGVTDASSVQITFTSHVTASTDGAVRAFAPGESGTFTLGRGDVLQISSGTPRTCAESGSTDMGAVTLASGDYNVEYRYCTTGDTYDLTGTIIRSTSPLALIGGHNCARVPTNRWACDHLEEVVFPLETWGTNALVVTTEPLHSEPNVIRILSGDDGNAIAFDPPSIHAGVSLNRGQFIEFEASQSFRASGSGSISVAQFLVGQDYAGFGTAAAGDNGDPSQSLAIPVEQYRTSYTFLAPMSYAISFVGVSAPTGAQVILDGSPIAGLTPVGGTGYDTANVSITGGVHSMTSSSPFGVVVYGFGSYTSYMYPGGLDLQRINVPF